MRSSTKMKWLTGCFEFILGIPFLGASIVIGFSWAPLGVMLLLHVITIIISARDGGNKYGSVIGIFTNLIAWIPFVGMTMHLITGIVLMVDAARGKTKRIE
ncbi:hypothetical protein [Salipaludibacillus sp. CF4.18]|uniref:hypothetical protein n=1 Tax=Salipaludibacillus sp. CF4.18 TaxID=3373081 RepID=UPI003EE4416F